MGCFVVLEGVDHSGKTTLLQTLVAKLQTANVQVIETLEPGESPVGQHLRSLLLHSSTTILPTTELLLFLADRYQHFVTFIQKNLQTADVVICDRYFYSTFVYQGLVKGVSWDLIFQFHQQLGLFVQVPDVVFFIETDPVTLESRSQEDTSFDRFHQLQDKQHFIQMNQFYKQTFQKLNDYYHQLVTIQTNQPLNQIVAKMTKIILQKCKLQTKS